MLFINTIFSRFTNRIFSPVLWSNVEPDEDVGDGLEEKKRNNGEHRQEGEKMPEVKNNHIYKQ